MTRPYTLAQTYEEQGSTLVEIPVALVPFVAGALRPLERRYLWASDADYERAYNALADLQRQLMGDTLRDLLESNRQIYRLLDTALNGTQYTAQQNLAEPERPLITPAIPAAPPAGTSAPNALRAHVGRLWHLAENASTGASYPADTGVDGAAALDFDGSWRARLNALQGTEGGFFGIGAQPVTLAKLLQAGRVNTAADQGLINDSFQEVLSVLSQGGNLFDVLTDVIATGADVATDGGVIAATLAATAANAAMLGTLAGQLDRLIASLDGGALVRPTGNVLESLKNVETMVS